MISEIDQSIVEALNTSANSHYIFIKIAFFVATNDIFKGIIIVTLLWYVWLKDSRKLSIDDAFIFRTAFGAVLAILIGRMAQNFLPMRLRPIHSPDINFVMPYEFLENVLEGWSSFPSDHAILFFALSTAIWSRDRRVGIFSFAWSLIVICFPRVYLGLHYPSDIFAGILLGVGIMLICLKVRLPVAVSTFLSRMRDRHVGWLYAGALFLSLQMATLFQSVRHLGKGAKAFLALVGLSI
jgi:undecaprenyl-diphosphatase